MGLRTIEWKSGSIKIIDQTLLPSELKYLYVRDIRTLWRAIKTLQVRGAPALGAAAGLGVYLAMKDSKAADTAAFLKELDRAVKYLGSSRPTARNLFWGLERMSRTARRCAGKPAALKKALFREACDIIEEDRDSCRRIGEYGSSMIKNGDSVLTVCNAGILATIDYGTALGVLYRAKEKGRKFRVYACETRPLLQGARLTTWELKRAGIDVTLICDNMAASLMRRGAIDKIITGADRIAANGDTANKIGTYSLAVLARHHGLPFYVAAPVSTFDRTIKSGEDIVIEQRPAAEVTGQYFKKNMSAAGVKVYNPSFDVTDNRLITAIITDKGLIEPPYAGGIKKVLDDES